MSYLNAKISQLQESIPDLITKARESLSQKLSFDRLKTNTQSWSVIIGSLVNIYGTCVQREFQIQNMDQIYGYVYTFFYRLGFNCVCSFVVRNPETEDLDCDANNYFSALKKYGITFGIENIIAKVI